MSARFFLLMIVLTVSLSFDFAKAQQPGPAIEVNPGPTAAPAKTQKIPEQNVPAKNLEPAVYEVLKILEWTSFYYQKPQPDLTVKMIKNMSSKGLFSNPASHPGILGFFSQLFALNGDKIKFWFGELNGLPADDRKILWLALWYANTPETKALLTSLSAQADPETRTGIEALLKNPAPALMTMDIKSPASMEILWGAFYATGDERYVLRVMTFLPFQAEQESPEKFALGQASYISLSGNTVKHPAVAGVVARELVKRDKTWQPFLRAVLDGAEELRAANRPSSVPPANTSSSHKK
ncbi:MAG: hypothetical protein SGI71_01700 [Verrucomicrobiota bacterium]|nr:hypothetical protein [Verrucomicrobiota bacterium]